MSLHLLLWLAAGIVATIAVFVPSPRFSLVAASLALLAFGFVASGAGA